MCFDAELEVIFGQHLHLEEEQDASIYCPTRSINSHWTYQTFSLVALGFFCFVVLIGSQMKTSSLIGFVGGRCEQKNKEYSSNFSGYEKQIHNNHKITIKKTLALTDHIVPESPRCLHSPHCAAKSEKLHCSPTHWLHCEIRESILYDYQTSKERPTSGRVRSQRAMSLSSSWCWCRVHLRQAGLNLSSSAVLWLECLHRGQNWGILHQYASWHC